MANLKRAMTPEWLKQRTNNLFILKNHDIFTTLVGFAHIAAMSRVGFETQRSEIESSKNLPHDVSRYLPSDIYSANRC